MEKILLAIDAVNPDMNSFDFACYIAGLTNSKVTGVFLENLVADERPVLRKVQGTLYLDWELDTPSPGYQDKQEMIEKNIVLFKEACEKKPVRCTVHRDRGIPAREIINETRFADVVVMNAAISFNRRYDGLPTEFAKQLLKDAECPVIIAPENFEGIDEIIFTYNGSRSSVFAMKQFTYLFPQLKDKKAIIVKVNEKGAWEGEDKYPLKEWLQNHYSSIGFKELKGDADDQFFDYLFKKENRFIVMGAYGRTDLSRFFKHSLADLIIKTITQPIFISHY